MKIHCYPALLTALLTASGCAVPMHQPPALPRRLPHSTQKLLSSLETEYRSFLATGDPQKVFAVFYWHVTQAILTRVKEGKVAHSDIILEIVEEFHADYRRSQHPATRTESWNHYYHKAASLRSGLHWREVVHPLDPAAPRSLLALAVTAHIDHDLPRCLRRVMDRHPEIRGAFLTELNAAFASLNDLFESCAMAGLMDVARHTPDAPGARVMSFQSAAARTIIQRKRLRAWRTALRGVTSR